LKCYFCNHDAVGQCQNDGRFACKQHGVIMNNKFVCIGCYVGPENLRRQKVMEMYEKAVIGSCAICGQTVLDPKMQYSIRSSNLATSIDWGKLEREASFLESTIRPCQNGCILCKNHQTDVTISKWSMNYYKIKCPVCKKSYKVKRW